MNRLVLVLSLSIHGSTGWGWQTSPSTVGRLRPLHMSLANFDDGSDRLFRNERDATSWRDKLGTSVFGRMVERAGTATTTATENMVRNGREEAMLNEKNGAIDSSTTTVTPTHVTGAKEGRLQFVGECKLPTRHGDFRLRAYRAGSSEYEPTVVIAGDVSGGDVLVRLHDQCMTSEVLGSERCDCKDQLDASLRLLAETGRGIVIYLQQEGRGIGLANKVAAYGLQDDGLDTVDANLALGFADEMRSYSVVPTILKDLGITSIKLLTNNPYKVENLVKLGVEISKRVPLVMAVRKNNQGYLRTKALRMSHLLPADMLVSEVDTTSASGPAPAAAPASAGVIDTTPEVFVNPVTGKTHSWCFGRDSVERTVAAIKRGELVVVTDDEDRENEGDLIMAAELATPETIAFMIRYTSGVLCVAMEDARLEALQLPQMVPNNQDPKNTAFTLTVDALGTADIDFSTGISATDRATTMRMLADPASTPDQFCRPGHIFPLRAKSQGVIERDGHTEASVDLCKMAGLAGAAGVLCEIVTADSVSMARMPELKVFAAEHNLEMTTIEDMICYRLQNEPGWASPSH